MPTFNGERFLRVTLETVEIQNLAGVEIIVVDDASTDGTGQEVLEVEAEDPRVRLLRREGARGLAGADFPGYRYFIGSFVGGALWPLISVLLKLPQRPRDRDDHV